MKYLSILAVVLLPLELLSASPPAIHFLEDGLPEVQRQAAREGKLYFLHFSADWSASCQWMEQYTFTDETLAAYVGQAYLALRVDVGSPEGRRLQEQYRVGILPSLLVFSSRGQLLGRLEGAMEAGVLLEQLQAYRRPSLSASLAGAAPGEDILPSPRPVFIISRPALFPDVPAGPELPAAPPASHTGRQQPAYFTIQVGVYASYSNAVRQCSSLEQKLGARAEIVPAPENGQNLYKIFLGRFEQQEEATAYLSNLRRDKIEGFVKLLEE